jgi:hypothetical protein
MRNFDCFVGIDWSGDKKARQKGLKIAIATPGSSPPNLKDGPGPKGRWSRTEAASFLGELVKEKRVLAGLDFAFGFPPLPPTMSNLVLDWEYVEQFCQSDGNLYGGRFFRIANAPHAELVNSPWVRGLRYSAHHLRATEKAAKETKGGTPQSIFNACGPAQVGPSSISGMRTLLRLQQLHGQDLSIWPFDEPHDTRSIIVEIFPRFFPLSRNLNPNLLDHANLNAALNAFNSKPVQTAPVSEDEGDALLAAAALRHLCTDAALFRLPENSARREGWIFGVPVT